MGLKHKKDDCLDEFVTRFNEDGQFKNMTVLKAENDEFKFTETKSFFKLFRDIYIVMLFLLFRLVGCIGKQYWRESIVEFQFCTLSACYFLQ